jgi:hypothetical protein
MIIIELQDMKETEKGIERVKINIKRITKTEKTREIIMIEKNTKIRNHTKIIKNIKIIRTIKILASTIKKIIRIGNNMKIVPKIGMIIILKEKKRIKIISMNN